MTHAPPHHYCATVA